MNLAKYGLPLTTIALGLALNLVGIVSGLLAQGSPHWTTWIPNLCGGFFILLGVLAVKTSLRMHMMHLALLLALLLGAMTTYLAVKELLIDEGTARRLFSFETTAVLCIAFLVVGIRSFLHARQARKTAEKATRTAESTAL
jgi:hypothetical protein